MTSGKCDTCKYKGTGTFGRCCLLRQNPPEAWDKCTAYKKKEGE
jgi:hypothetical protein